LSAGDGIGNAAKACVERGSQEKGVGVHGAKLLQTSWLSWTTTRKTREMLSGNSLPTSKAMDWEQVATCWCRTSRGSGARWGRKSIQ